MIPALLVAVGGAVGAALRHWAVTRVGPFAGLLAVNVGGSLVLGVLTGAAVASPFAALLGTGCCGALTTYSGFALEALRLPRRRAAVHVGASVAGTVAAAAAGLALGVSLA